MRNIVTLWFVFFSLLLGGCAATPWGAVGAGASIAYNLYVTWKDGEATKYYVYDTKVVHRAVRLALNDMELPVNSDNADQGSSRDRSRFRKGARVPATTDQGFQIMAGNRNRFKIRIQPVEKNICRLKVRIDFWGDKPYVESLYHKVDEYLNVVTYGPDGKVKLNDQRSNQPVVPHLP